MEDERTVIFLQPPAAAGRDRGVEGGGRDPLVLGEQVVREPVEVGDAADHRRAGDEVVAVGQQLAEQGRVLGVAADEAVAGDGPRRAGDLAVLREVVQPDDLVAGREQLLDDVAADEPRGRR